MSGIFGEGCFVSAEDYEAAALVFQHGEVPDHYYQAFIWANKASKLGSVKAKHWNIQILLFPSDMNGWRI